MPVRRMLWSGGACMSSLRWAGVREMLSHIDSDAVHVCGDSVSVSRVASADARADETALAHCTYVW